MKSPNFFGETGLDRMSERRTDKNWLRSLTESADAVVLQSLNQGIKHRMETKS